MKELKENFKELKPETQFPINFNIKNNPTLLKYDEFFLYKKGGKSDIHIKKKNKGKFTSYCGGQVTGDCIAKAKASGNPTLIKRAVFAQNARKWKHRQGGLINLLIQKHQTGGSFKDPKTTNAIQIYQHFIDNGIPEQAALELTNQKIAEGGWKGYSSGDGKKFNNVDNFIDHIIDWHNKMYPDSLKANSFNQFFNSLEYGKHKYNPNPNSYKQHLLETRPGVKKRINEYRNSLGQQPLSLLYNNTNNV